MGKMKRNILYFQSEKATMGRDTSKIPSLLFMLTVPDILNMHLISLFRYATGILRTYVIRSLIKSVLNHFFS